MSRPRGITGHPIAQLVRDLRVQVAQAERAGADDRDLCIAAPAGYLALVSGFPTVEIDGSVVALTTKRWASNMADTAVREASW